MPHVMKMTHLTPQEVIAELAKRWKKCEESHYTLFVLAYQGQHGPSESTEKTVEHDLETYQKKRELPSYVIRAAQKEGILPDPSTEPRGD